MSEQAAPVPGADGTAGRHSAVLAPGTGAAPVPPGTAPDSAALVPLSAASRASAALCRHARGLWLDPGRLLHSLYHGKPGSMAEHMAYLKSAAWVPEEMTGRPREFLAAAGIAYHVLIAWPLKLAAKAIDSAADRPLRLAGLAVLVLALIVLL